ncbi:transcription initiation factor IIB [Candidatus Bathyarchaeota archaeon]|nr:transcription initiation factor IIB [Candidatus Bathyarchaeota archaeon]
MEVITQQASCDVCDGTERIHDEVNGEIVCARCGLVRTDEVFNHGPEWRAFTPSESAKRERATPTPYSAFEGGMFTRFREGRDANGTKLNPEQLQKWRRLRRFDLRTKSDDNKIRNLNQATVEVERYTDRLHLPRGIKDTALFIYRKALKEDLIRGRTISDFVAAAVYAACRGSNVPRSLSNVSEASGRSVKDISRTYRLLVRSLKLRMPVDNPMKFVPRIAGSLNIDVETERKTIESLRRAGERKLLIGKDPRSMATAALYMACKSNKRKMTQKKLADAAGISTVSLRNRLRELEAAFSD